MDPLLSAPSRSPSGIGTTATTEPLRYRASMFRHVVMFRWATSSTPEQREQLSAALAELPGAIAEIRRYHFGPDAAINEGNFDFAVVADFDDAEGYLIYRDHPRHQQVIAELIAGFIDTRAAVQFDLSR